MPTLERGVDQFLEASLAEELNPTWHSAAGVVWGNSTVTMAEMWESFVKVSLKASSYQLPIVSTSETLDITDNE